MSKKPKQPPTAPPDPAEAMRARGKSPELAAVLAWLIPGSGHIYAGHRAKGVGGLVFVLGMFLWGLVLSGGEAVSLQEEGGHEYAFLAQIGAGLPTGLGLAYTHRKLPGLKPPEREHWDSPAYASRLPDIDTGLLFTAVAGLLNLLLVHDALSGVPGAMGRRLEEQRRQARIESVRKELEREQAKAARQEPGAADEGDLAAQDAPTDEAAEAPAERPTEQPAEEEA